MSGRINPVPGVEMTPHDRRLWLASKGAPPGVLIVYERELTQITNQLLGAKMEADRLREMTNRAADHLDNYWRTQPDFENACAAAVFDAKRFHRIAERCLLDVDSFLTLLQSLANHMDDPTGLAIIYAEADRVGETLAFVREQMALRREFTKPEAKL